MPEKIYLDDEFKKIWTLIEAGENIAFLRHGDGERAIMEGRSIKAQEGWESPGYVSQLGSACLDALNLRDPRVWYGISCPCCDPAAYYWYISRIAHRNITFANLWVNSNYCTFIKAFENLEREAIVIANHRAQNKPIGKLNVLKYYPVGDDCISFWENDAPKLLQRIKSEYGMRDNLLYVVSAGPMSGPIIAELFKNNPNNCYIDFGSSIDTYIHNKITRPYMNKNSRYAKRQCWMYDPKTTNFDVTVVCNLYKRPDNLLKQLEAINNQTLKPKEILLYQDGISDNYKIDLLPSLKDKFDNVKIATENTGVWKRFEYAKSSASSPLICIFDDDTIPGKRWLENCYCCMQKQEGVYGTIGIVMRYPVKYPFGGFLRVGWGGPNSKTIEVDFVGHSWFVKKEYLDYMFDGTEMYQSFKYAGEDMCISAQCQKRGIKTFVPPHPYINHDLWGSLPEYAKVLGNSIQALYLDNKNFISMNNCMALYLSNGWQAIVNTNKRYPYYILYKIIEQQIIGRYRALVLKVERKIYSFIPKKSCIFDGKRL
ncbi:MAG: glycosyltransferase family A protein [Desulfobacterales bacterium]|nr:glycosyltransferase family A protein [Desulfobacterales bacterium]